MVSIILLPIIGSSSSNNKTTCLPESMVTESLPDEGNSRGCQVCPWP
uniref:Uncharacterized protein n=1 Tax=Arundo donax TaxID=35708 RepID=A0A0A8Z9X3_ARUDO